MKLYLRSLLVLNLLVSGSSWSSESNYARFVRMYERGNEASFLDIGPNTTCVSFRKSSDERISACMTVARYSYSGRAVARPALVLEFSPYNNLNPFSCWDVNAGGSGGAEAKYYFDNAKFSSVNGALKISSSGWIAGSLHSLLANFRVSGGNLYFLVSLDGSGAPGDQLAGYCEL